MHAETEAVHQRVEVVARVLRIERARQLHGAQHRRGKRHAEPTELRAQEAVIEARVVRDEQPALRAGAAPPGATSANGGASATIESSMPVNDAINDGMRMPGCTSVLHSSTISPCSSSTMPTSMTRCCAAIPPVVSRSTQATGPRNECACSAHGRRGVRHAFSPGHGRPARGSGSRVRDVGHGTRPTRDAARAAGRGRTSRSARPRPRDPLPPPCRRCCRR